MATMLRCAIAGIRSRSARGLTWLRTVSCPPSLPEDYMSVAKVIEIISSSSKSFDDAISKGISRASETISDITGAWVKDQSVEVTKGKITEYRVILKLTFVLKKGKGG
jgi:dodecin